MKDFLIFSDAQQRPIALDSLRDINSYFIPLRPVVTSNVAIDSAFIASNTQDQYHIKVALKSTDELQSTPVSLYNNNELYAKTSAEFENGKTTVDFNVGPEFKKGRIEVNDKGMNYDNSLYFSINAPQKINVLSINGSEDEFLKRIYTSDEFIYNSTSLDQLDFNSLTKQNFIILNQLTTIPEVLRSTLVDASEKGVKICVIPNQSDNYITKQPLFPFLADLKFLQKNNTEKHITTIAYQHPLFDQVFEGNVSNFQYPKTAVSFVVSGTHQSVLGYGDGSDFLIEVNGHYAFTAPLSTANTNFQSTPLIVPVFYNMAQQSLPTPTLYYNLGMVNTIAVNTQLPQDHVLTMENDHESFIPLQMNYQHYVSITTGEYPTTQGIYWVKKDAEQLLTLSFNHQRSESSTIYLSENHFPANQSLQNPTQTFKDIKSENNINELWKWFVIFALIFLC